MLWDKYKMATSKKVIDRGGMGLKKMIEWIINCKWPKFNINKGKNKCNKGDKI